MKKGSNKRIISYNYIKYIFALFFFIAIANIFFIQKNLMKFNSDTWIYKPKKRVVIIDDLLKNVSLHGKTKTEIAELLGENDNFLGLADEDYCIYWVSDKTDLLQDKSQWLYIEFEDGKVSNYYLTIN